MYQISEEAIKEKDFITEEDTYDFIGFVADSVEISFDILGDIEWLLDSFPRYAKALFVYNDLEKSIIFKEGFKEEFFKNNYERLKAAVKDLSLEAFAGVSEQKIDIFSIEQMLRKTFGFYVSYFYGYYTFDEFIRYTVVPETKYYFGQTFDYHA